MELNWETIFLVFTIISGIVSFNDLVEDLIDIVKVIIKIVKWIIKKIQNARKK